MARQTTRKKNQSMQSSQTRAEDFAPAQLPPELRHVSDLASPADSLNREIIRMLQEDGRMAFAEIASALEVSEGTIRNRVNAMKQAKQLRIVAITDPRVMEYRTDAILGLKVAGGISPSSVAERLGAHPEVVYILWLAGRFDLLVEVVTDEAGALQRFLEERVHADPDIISVETMTGLRNFKNQFLLKRNWA